MKPRSLNVITREKWLRNAVEELDSRLFNGDLDLYGHPDYQVSMGKCGKKIAESFYPYDGEDVTTDDFFPITIQVSWSEKDPITILANLAYECIHAFFDERKCSKRFKKLAEKYYFDKPYSKCNITPELRDILEDVYKVIGECPGSPVVQRPKEKKDGKKNTIIIFCPNCNTEFKVSKKDWEKNTSGLPTCGCGTKMGIDLTDETNGETTSTEN